MTTEPTTTKTAIVLLGGASHVTGLGEVPSDALVIAADSGVSLADALGLRVDVVIGDMDSINPTALNALAAMGTEVVSHPIDKDATDAELALLHAAKNGVDHLLVLGAGGGRLDHQLALFAVLFNDALRKVRIEARLGASRAFPLRDGETLSVRCGAGTVVGLIPFGGDAHGVTTTGLQWPLGDESLFANASRGVSNRATNDHISVAIASGRLLVTLDEPDNR